MGVQVPPAAPKINMLKLINKIIELTVLTAILIFELYGSFKKIDCKAQTTPTAKIRHDPNPKIVNKKSEILAPKGPPKLFIVCDEVL